MERNCPSSCGLCRSEGNGDVDSGGKCRMYLAESTASGGLGIYAATPLAAGEGLPFVSDLVIHLNDLEYNDRLRRLKKKVADDGHRSRLASFAWNPTSDTFGTHEAINVCSLSSGLGMSSKRRRLGSANVVLGAPNIDSGRLHRSSHAGAGGITDFHNRTATALLPISAGSEILIQYGQDIAAGDEHSAQRADAMLGAIFDLAHEVESSVFEADLYSFVMQHIGADKELRNLMPKTLDEAKEIHANGGSSLISDQESKRSVQWLQTNGLCVDNIREGLSTNGEAGRGAFATRRLKTGEVIAPAPVIPIHRDTLEVYFQDDTDTINLMGHQLIKNYCFGHAKSSMLLFPYAPGVNLINHLGESPNAHVRWSTHPYNDAADWKERTVQDLLNAKQQITLVMEIVANRPIERGEEIFIDYGRDWVDAWTKQENTWETTISNDSDIYLSAKATDESAQIVLTVEEQEKEPYHNNIATGCYVKIDGGWALAEASDGSPAKIRKCDIIARKGDAEEIDSIRYTAEVSNENDEISTITDIPRGALTFIDLEYSNEQYIRGALRHEIGVPDGLYPEAWLDLKEDTTSGDACQLYMAESSIPDSGLGMYTMKDIKENEPIFFPGIVVQQQDHDWHQKERRFWLNAEEYEQEWQLHNYFWEARNTLGMFDGELDMQSIIPGLGMLANSHTGLVNALMTRPQINTAGLHRSVDPGSGAFSAYHKYTYLATQNIPAGMELFARYGDEWFAERESLFGRVPLSDHFTDTDAILKNFFPLVDVLDDEELKGQLWDIIYKYLAEHNNMEIVLPKDLEDVRRFVEKGTAITSLPNVIRSREWLDENGRCLDNIREDRSTVAQAGRGAFATRSLGEGTLIAPMPLVHIKRMHLNMLEWLDDEESSTYRMEQMLLNYCYGHRNSSMLLFPYSPSVNFINHNGKSPNAYLRWSLMENHKLDWFERDVEDLMKENHAGLIMELVALREIKNGEEIFIDYGKRWSEAWDKHVREWTPVEGAEHYVSASDLNDIGAPFLTMDELNESPLPEHITRVCYIAASVEDQKPNEGPFGDHYFWTNQENLMIFHDNAYDCDILSRDEEYEGLSGSVRPERVTYTGRVYRFLETEEDSSIIVHGIPPRAIEFTDRPETKDQYLRNAFRHEIEIPDELFPKVWMDLPNGAEQYYLETRQRLTYNPGNDEL